MTHNVMLLTGGLGRGGTELSVAALARGLQAETSYRPCLTVLSRSGELGRELREQGIMVEQLEASGRFYEPRRWIRLLRLRRLVSQRMSIVHTFLYDADVYGMMAARLGKPSAIVTTRRAIKSHRPGHLRGYRLTNRFVDRVVANSEAVRRFTVEYEQLDPAKVMTIPNGIDVDRFGSGNREDGRKLLGVPANAQLIAAVGAIRPIKGQDMLLEAVTPLMQADSELFTIVIGQRRGDFAQRLEQRAVERGLGDRFLLPGCQSDVPSVLAAADLFVLPSRSEGMSNALIEAMAAGCPIVATDVGGNAEVLAHGEAGLVVEPKPSAIRAAVETLLRQPQQAGQIATRARDRAEQEYSFATMLRRTVSLYDELLNRE